LSSGESATVIVLQMGVDVVVDLTGPDGKLIDSVDSPNGREGDEPVEILSRRTGDYLVRVRSIDAREPEGRYRITVTAWHNAKETSRLLQTKALARDEAIRWLRPLSATLTGTDFIASDVPLPPLDALAQRVRVLGIGEATHGTREFGDLRLAITKRLIERHGYRIVAIEMSAVRLAVLDSYVSAQASPSLDVKRTIESGLWIGQRSLRVLVEWLRAWNVAHPAERVRLVGLDAQDNTGAREALSRFLTSAYGPAVTTRWETVDREIAAADLQTLVFGDSGVDPTVRQSLLEFVALLDLDAPLLAHRFGEAAVHSALQAARVLAQFADFNAGGVGTSTHSRDWYMATNVLGALAESGPESKAIFWGHNAHVWAPPGRPEVRRSTGALLRDVLGCSYGALGVTFGEGAFVAQIPNDLEDRLQVSTLTAAPEESIEGVLVKLDPRAELNGVLVAWPCDTKPADAPGWLQKAQVMHWVGGLYTPGSAPTAAFRAYELLRDFDGIVYLPRVTAEEVPPDRPVIPARHR